MMESEINALSLSPKPGYILVDQMYQNPIEDYDIAFEEDLTKMKEMGLPLGFLNTTPFEVEENDGVIKVAVSSKKQGKKKKRGKKKKVVPQDYAEEFNSGWWEEHGNEAIMQVWTERYGTSRLCRGVQFCLVGGAWQRSYYAGLDREIWYLKIMQRSSILFGGRSMATKLL